MIADWNPVTNKKDEEIKELREIMEGFIAHGPLRFKLESGTYYCIYCNAESKVQAIYDHGSDCAYGRAKKLTEK